MARSDGLTPPWLRGQRTLRRGAAAAPRFMPAGGGTQVAASRRVRRPAAAPREGMQGDRGAQMMLLAAVILVIGFVALSGVVVRVNQAGVQTALEQDVPILQEASRLAGAVDRAVVNVNASLTNATLEEFQAALNGTLDHLRVLESARGYRMVHRLDGCPDGEGFVVVWLYDPKLMLGFRSTQTWDC